MGVSPGFTGFDAGSVTGFTIPARYSVNDVCTDSTGKTAAACTCSPAGGRSTGVIFTMNGSFDSLVVQHRRIHGLNSIFCLPEGYLVTGPADPNFRDTAVSMIGEDGSVSWVLIMDNPGNTGGTPWRVCCGTSGGDAVLSAGSSIALVDRTGSLLWTNSFGNETTVNAACADAEGVIFAGERPGLEHTCAFACRYDLTGELQWERDYDLGGYGEFLSVTPVPDGYLFCGSHWAFTSPRSGLLVGTDLSGDEPFIAFAPAPEGYQKAYLSSVEPLSNGEFAGLGYAVESGCAEGSTHGFLALFSSSRSFIESLCYGNGGGHLLEFSGAFSDTSGVPVLLGLDRSPSGETFCFSVLPE